MNVLWANVEPEIPEIGEIGHDLRSKTKNLSMKANENCQFFILKIEKMSVSALGTILEKWQSSSLIYCLTILK